MPEDKLQYSTNRWNEWLWRRFPHSEGWVPEEFVNWGFGSSFALILNLFLWWDTWCYIFKTLVQDQHKKTTTLGPLARTKKYTCSSACIRLAEKSRSLRPPGVLASRSDISCSVPHSAVALPRDAARLNETRTLYKFPIKISIIHFHAIFFFFPGVHIGGREKETPSTLSQGIGIHGLSEEAIPGIKGMLWHIRTLKYVLPQMMDKGLKDKNKLEILEMLTHDQCEVIQI